MKQIINARDLTQSYSDLNSRLSKNINKILLTTLSRGGSTQDAVAKIKSKVRQISESKIETIVRTETHNVLNAARESSYRQLKIPDKFKWLSTPDNRRTIYCQLISNETTKGVSMEKLKAVIAKHADKKIYSPSKPFLPHLNCRSALVAVNV